ncbi:MAG: hypothetical protein KAI29_21290, partial [Cyclobacteriaceae bacterium]|nr:hypothetical protein [Cyclobacteriaceae bacterium]
FHFLLTEASFQYALIMLKSFVQSLFSMPHLGSHLFSHYELGSAEEAEYWVWENTDAAEYPSPKMT